MHGSIAHHGSRCSVSTNVCLWCDPQTDSIDVTLSTASSYVFYVMICVPYQICLFLFNRMVRESKRERKINRTIKIRKVEF